VSGDDHLVGPVTAQLILDARDRIDRVPYVPFRHQTLAARGVQDCAQPLACLCGLAIDVGRDEMRP
jgi:hypothetical protein